MASQEKRIVVIGSSVAWGSYATNDEGWAYKLGEHLSKRDWKFKNLAVGGADTYLTLQRLTKNVLPEKPDVIIIGLSLRNEGLIEDRELAVLSFRKNMQEMIKRIKDIGSIPVLGGLYPSNLYKSWHYNELRKMQEEMQTWGVLVFPFLSATDDGQGHWKPGIFSDEAHPNDEGHRLMFESIPLEYFNQLKL